MTVPEAEQPVLAVMDTVYGVVVVMAVATGFWIVVLLRKVAGLQAYVKAAAPPLTVTL